MRYTIDQLLADSKLPGPRCNLELLHAFSRSAEEGPVRDCLARIRKDTANSPDEFVGMCGIVAYAVLHAAEIEDTMAFIRVYAGHASWRIREAVGFAVQKIAVNDLSLVVDCFRPWIEGTALERRAVVASLCEPTLLKIDETKHEIPAILKKLTDGFEGSDKLDEEQKVLRQALGYGWSIAIVAQVEVGKRMLESYKGSSNKHVRWIVRENLKKNRLLKLDPAWVASMNAAFE